MLSLSRVVRALLALVIVVGVAACSRNDPAAFVASALTVSLTGVPTWERSRRFSKSRGAGFRPT